jgi:hypothetical protein
MTFLLFRVRDGAPKKKKIFELFRTVDVRMYVWTYSTEENLPKNILTCWYIDFYSNYKGSRLKWSLWDQDKVITLTEWQQKMTSYWYKITKTGLWDLVNLGISDHINWMITLTVITLRGFHCTYIFHGKFLECCKLLRKK